MANRAWKLPKGSCNPAMVCLTGVWKFALDGSLTDVQAQGIVPGNLRADGSHPGQQRIYFGSMIGGDFIVDRYPTNTLINAQIVATNIAYSDGEARFAVVRGESFTSGSYFTLRWQKLLVTPSATLDDYTALRADMEDYEVKACFWLQNSDEFAADLD
jgi:hypothetical protein